MMSRTELRQFSEQGFLAVRGCVPEADVHRARDAVWTDLMARYDVADDPATWRGQYLNCGATALKDFKTMPSARTIQALDDLLGVDRWRSDHRHESCGTVFASLPRRGEDAWTVAGEWHWDLGAGRHLPRYTGLLVCTLLTDADHGDGGTLFVSGSHYFVAAHFERTRGQFSDNHSAAEMQSFFATEEWFHDLDQGAVPEADRVAAYMDRSSTVDGIRLRVHEMTGKAGDAFFLHPLLVHAGPPNGGRRPRIMHRSFVWHHPLPAA